MVIKPRYAKIKFEGWNTIASLINDREELEVWLKDGSLVEGDIVYGFKLKYRVTTWKDGSLVLDDISYEKEVSK